MVVKTLIAFASLFILSFHINTASADDYSNTHALVDQSTILFQSFGQDPEMDWSHRNIIIRHSATNPQSEKLRKVVAEQSKLKTTKVSY